MPGWLRLIFLWMLLGLAVGCSTREPVAPAANPSEASSSGSSAALDPNRPYTPPDLTLLGATARPQFLNAYANW